MKEPEIAQSSIELLWPTRVVTRQTAFHASALPLSRAIERKLIDEVADAIESAFPGRERIVSSELRQEEWREGNGALLWHGGGSWQAIWCGALRPRRSGGVHLQVSDPRAGCDNVFVPHAPFGRPLTLPLEDGLLAVLPAWLEWSASPLRPGQSAVMVRVAVTTQRITRTKREEEAQCLTTTT